MLDQNLAEIPRLYDWPERLYAFLESKKSTPFKWGVNDCCTFAADVVFECTGVDPIDNLRPDGLASWSTELQASKVLKRHGGLAAMVTSRLGQPIAVPMAQRGDVMMINMHDRAALVICLGAQYAGAGPAAITYGSINEATMAWRV
jgi:hypothetical protein